MAEPLLALPSELQSCVARACSPISLLRLEATSSFWLQLIRDSGWLWDIKFQEAEPIVAPPLLHLGASRALFLAFAQRSRIRDPCFGIDSNFDDDSHDEVDDEGPLVLFTCGDHAGLLSWDGLNADGYPLSLSVHPLLAWTPQTKLVGNFMDEEHDGLTWTRNVGGELEFHEPTSCYVIGLSRTSALVHTIWEACLPEDVEILDQDSWCGFEYQQHVAGDALTYQHGRGAVVGVPWCLAISSFPADSDPADFGVRAAEFKAYLRLRREPNGQRSLHEATVCFGINGWGEIQSVREGKHLLRALARTSANELRPMNDIMRAALDFRAASW